MNIQYIGFQKNRHSTSGLVPTFSKCLGPEKYYPGPGQHVCIICIGTIKGDDTELPSVCMAGMPELTTFASDNIEMSFT